MVAWAVSGGADADMVVACTWTWGGAGAGITIGLGDAKKVSWGIIGDDNSVGLLVVP